MIILVAFSVFCIKGYYERFQVVYNAIEALKAGEVTSATQWRVTKEGGDNEVYVFNFSYRVGDFKDDIVRKSSHRSAYRKQEELIYSNSNPKRALLLKDLPADLRSRIFKEQELSS